MEFRNLNRLTEWDNLPQGDYVVQNPDPSLYAFNKSNNKITIFIMIDKHMKDCASEPLHHKTPSHTLIHSKNPPKSP